MLLANSIRLGQIALLAALCATAGCGGSDSAPQAGAGSGSPIAPEPAGPPPPHAPKLATAAGNAAQAGTDLATQVSRAAALATELEPELAKVTFEATAPRALVVQAGGRQADIARSDIPPHERWEIRFPPGNSIESYTRQLDHFKIELGAIGVEDHITYLTNLSNPKPKTRPGFASDESRLYLVWQRGEMAEADEQLATRAGVRTQGKVLAHFVPSEVETELARLEEAFARQLGIQKIQKTVFGIRVAGQDSFRFYVIEQKADLR
jgi:hypothetical protein